MDALLAEHGWLWRPQPFKEARPAWYGRLPELTEALLALGDEEVARLEADVGALTDLLSRHVPDLRALEALARLPERGGAKAGPADHRIQWEIPGRKWEQIEAFAGAVGPVRGPILEWCGGKGHLGRLLGAREGVPVGTLELDAALCAEGRDLARRAGVEQRFHNADALSREAALLLPGRHVVALHACGDLHRTLVERGVEARVPALDLAPCCYYRGAEKTYRPWSKSPLLELGRDDLRLAVTETVTSAPREVRQRVRERVWKLGFDRLRREVTDLDRYAPFKPTPREWLKLGFRGFCEALAAREGLALPPSLDWAGREAEAWRRHGEVVRLSLVRAAFRRPLELWLVLDLAARLADQGYRVEVGTFCARRLTPRNILLSARA